MSDVPQNPDTHLRTLWETVQKLLSQLLLTATPDLLSALTLMTAKVQQSQEGHSACTLVALTLALGSIGSQKQIFLPPLSNLLGLASFKKKCSFILLSIRFLFI